MLTGGLESGVMRKSMKLPDEDKGARDIARALRPQLEAAEKLFECVLGAAQGAPAAGGPHLRACLSAALARLLRLHYAAVKLASAGVAAEARPQIRALFELVVHVRALAQSSDPEEYARRWIAWELRGDAAGRELSEALKGDLDAEARKDAQGRWPREPERIEAFVAGRWTEFLKHGPSRADLRSLAAAVDMRSQDKTKLAATYDALFPAVSGALPSAPLRARLDLPEGAPLTPALVPTREDVETVLVTSVVLLEMGALAVAGRLGLGAADFQKQMLSIISPALAR